MYTIVPLEIVFNEDEEEQPKKRKMIDVGAMKLEVEQSSETEYQILRIISSNPYDYLDSRYQPGNKLALQPLLK
ncbi:YlzJ-like family protein [Camelliibacillus cellulosilyticus]|uniref:YlzJ-like family protein n=2 Tax=Camelliibacillus cellulosilyticus TaxID=2174486 RepID=A0ABV9GJQ3_9BACL